MKFARSVHVQLSQEWKTVALHATNAFFGYLFYFDVFHETNQKKKPRKSCSTSDGIRGETNAPKLHSSVKMWIDMPCLIWSLICMWMTKKIKSDRLFVVVYGEYDQILILFIALVTILRILTCNIRSVHFQLWFYHLVSLL